MSFNSYDFTIKLTYTEEDNTTDYRIIEKAMLFVNIDPNSNKLCALTLREAYKIKEIDLEHLDKNVTLNYDDMIDNLTKEELMRLMFKTITFNC
jgi:hypothetical protein